MLGPMVNPSNPKKQMIGVFSLELARLYSYLYQNNNKQFSIIHSLDGYDEISLTGSFKMISNDGEKVISPKDLGFTPLSAESISGGGTIEESAKIFEDVLKGHGTYAQNAVVLANSAAALQTADQQLNLRDAVQKAEEALKSGKALQVFKALVMPKTSISFSTKQ